MPKRYWVCEDCGERFWQDEDCQTSFTHYCPAQPGVKVFCPPPWADKDKGTNKNEQIKKGD